MRRLFRKAWFAVAIALAAPLAAESGNGGPPGYTPEKLSRASGLDAGNGAVIISVRSELFLLDTLNLFFVREGGDTSNDADVIRFTRAQPPLAFSNATAKYKPRAFQMAAGRYRLAGHGVRCPKVPDIDERCLVDVKVLGIGETVSFPSRGYGPDAPVIEVREGALTIAGDFALTARNTVEWSEIPSDKLRKAERRIKGIPRGPEPLVSSDFRLQYPLRARAPEDDKGRRY